VREQHRPRKTSHSCDVQLNYWEALNPRPPTPKMERVPLNTKEKLLLTDQTKTQKMLRTFSNKG